MQPTCSATWQSSSCWQLFGLAAAALIGCGRQDGVVGRNYPADAATNAPSFQSEFVSNPGVWSIETGFSLASVDFGRTDANARDGKVAELRFPGDTGLAAADGAGPAYVTQLATLERFHFGTLRTRVSFGSCAAGEEVVHAILGYFSDGTDLDGNGLTDNIEIDLQIACGTPQYAYLSLYTDYQATADGPVFRKLSHIVDFSSGAKYDTPEDDSDEFVASGTDPNLLRPNLVSANTYYELGYEWHPESIRFFIVDGADELTLWTLSDASHVPQLPVYLMYNLWHPETHWFPTQGEADFPAADVVMKVDWVEFVPSD
jgi:hypothetical protein